MSRGSNNWKRILFNFALLLSLLYFPWWITALIGVLFIVSEQPFEIVIWGILIDALAGAPVPSFLGVEMLFTLSFFALLIIARLVRERLMMERI